MRYRQTIYNGIITNVDYSDMKAENAQDTNSVDISTIGELSNDTLGMEKQHTSAQANDIVSIIQLGDSETIVIVNNL